MKLPLTETAWLLTLALMGCDPHSSRYGEREVDAASYASLERIARADEQVKHEVRNAMSDNKVTINEANIIIDAWEDRQAEAARASLRETLKGAQKETRTTATTTIETD